MEKTKGYFWQKTGGKRVIVGISQKALLEAGDIRGIKLPPRGVFLCAGEPLITLMATDKELKLPSPLTGQVVEVNWELAKLPELLSSTCESWVAILIPQRIALTKLLSREKRRGPSLV